MTHTSTDHTATDAATHADTPLQSPPGMELFTFGDPEPVMDAAEIFDYMHTWSNGNWYEPPISFAGLAKSVRAGTHHGSAIYFTRDLVLSCFKPHPLLDRATFSGWVLDYLVFGNAFLERIDSRTGRPLKLKRSLGKYTRVGVDLVSCWFVKSAGEEHQFAPGAVHHLLEPDINQEVYGMPQYIGALQSAWLNESATLFRRRYYNNGSHAGFILYISDPAQNQGDIDGIRTALKNSKGPGNFKNLFFYSPNGKKDGIQLIPISEVAARDQFMDIKNTSRDDVLAAHRVPPQLMGIVPGNTGGFGAVLPAAQVFSRNSLQPLMSKLLELNDWMGMEVVRFDPYVVPTDGTTGTGAGVGTGLVPTPGA